MKYVNKRLLKEKHLVNKSFSAWSDGTIEVWDKNGVHVTLNKQEAGSFQRFIFSRFQYNK